MYYNTYEYNPEYDESILGVPYVCKVKDLPKIYPKRAGAIIYYQNLEKGEVKEPLEMSELKREYSYGKVKLLKREKALVNHKPKLINEEKISTRINEVNPNIIDNVVLQNSSKADRIYGLGVDTQFGTLTDFAGGVKYKYDKTAVQAALRELREESLCLFNFTEDQIQDCLCIYNNDILIIFIPSKIPLNNCALFFESLVSKESKPEVSKLKWFTEKELIQTIERPYVIYEPVRVLLHKTITQLVSKLN